MGNTHWVFSPLRESLFFLVTLWHDPKIVHKPAPSLDFACHMHEFTTLWHLWQIAFVTRQCHKRALAEHPLLWHVRQYHNNVHKTDKRKLDAGLCTVLYPCHIVLRRIFRFYAPKFHGTHTLPFWTFLFKSPLKAHKFLRQSHKTVHYPASSLCLSVTCLMLQLTYF